ncbi:hypothetical protein K439DRAFT_1398053 [Ramaria rubella]|nr:hypothetical protein K439DRAFT_1398053 [Ramaria rubella]
MQSDSLLLPISLNGYGQGSILEEVCAIASPSKLISWGLDVEHEGDTGTAPMAGAAIGCEDGTIYIFGVNAVDAPDQLPAHNMTIGNSLAPALHISRVSPSASPSSSRRDSLNSRSASSSNLAPHLLSQSARSHVTSSVSRTSAEAPKNYVDYDDEKTKLEGILKSGQTRERSIAEGLRASYGVAGLGVAGETGGIGESQRKKSKLSYTGGSSSAPGTPRESLSSPPSTRSFSPLPSPSFPEFAHLSSHIGIAPPITPKFHVFPPRFGTGNTIVSLQNLSYGIFLALQESGVVAVILSQTGLCLGSVELESTPYLHPPPSPLSSTFMSTAGNNTVWKWKYLHVLENEECTVILAVASESSMTSDSDPDSRTRVAVLELQKLNPFLSSLGSAATSRHGVLQKVSEWVMESAPEALGLLSGEDAASAKIVYLTPGQSSTLMVHNLQIVPPAYVMAAPESLQPSPDAISSHPITLSAAPASLPGLLLPIPNPFKPKIQDHPLDRDSAKSTTTVPGRVVLGPALAIGQAPMPRGGRSVIGMQLWTMNGKCVRGALWSHDDFLVFETEAPGSEIRILGNASHHGLIAVERLGPDTFILAETYRVNAFCLPQTQVSSTSHPAHIPNWLEHLSSATFDGPCLAATAISASLLLCSTGSTGSEQQRLVYVALAPVSTTKKRKKNRDDKKNLRTAWSVSKQCAGMEQESVRRLTSLLPIELDMIILGFNDGSLGRSSFVNILTIGWPTVCEKSTNTNGINGMITSLHSIQNERTSERLIVGGVDDGGIVVWDLSTLQLRAQWTIFTTPLLTVISLEEEGVGRLRDCILCVSNDGTLAVIAVDGLEFLYLIPGSAARLDRICLGEDNLLLVYADGRARLWDVKTQEFWRSMTTKAVDELLKQGGWFEADVTNESRGGEKPLASLKKSFSSHDAASTLILNIHSLSELIHPIPSSHIFRDPRLAESVSVRTKDVIQADAPLLTKRIFRRLNLLKALLSSLLSFGIDVNVDEICIEKLGIIPAMASVGIRSADQVTSLPNTSSPQEVWQISPEHTASRLLALVTILRGLLVYDEDCEEHANLVIAFYVTSLQDAIGPAWQAPSLSSLARYWFHPSSDLRLAARTLFGAAADRLSDEDAIHLVEHWQHELPCLQPDAEKQSAYSALALLITGNVATERYVVLSTSTLTDIAKSITLYLHDDDCPHRILAIDLCSRGFQVWQHYVDAMEVLRALFNLSTSAEKDRNAGPQARSAVLQIASSNTPLFMSTLSLDILHPRTLRQQKSIMQLVAFLIRKKPLVLYSHLPRLIEAVVKSLDPASSSDRDAVFDSATEILGQVVKTFPSVDFHMQSQRLCVGTNEGAVIMYDLKTATRLYVLEGHKKRLAGCSFSPDGRRLATVSLEESIVRVWKVGSSLTSLFMPGAPPRQGHSGSEPYKTLNFNVGDEVNMTVAATLEWVQFEWPDDRTARLKIRDSAFTFNT